MYNIKLPDLSVISDERKEYLEKNADELCRRCNLGKYLDDEYYPREKLKYMEIPSEFYSPEELYFTVHFLRMRWNTTPVKSSSWEYFRMNIPPFVQKLLFDLDRKWIETQSDINFTQSEKNYFSQEWILEEAISSSQIEWAQTTANVAKEIIMRNGQPKNKHEIMVVNNYQAMLFITNEINNVALSKDVLLDIQNIVTKNTLDDEWKSWRFRTDDDNIVVMNAVSWEIYHIPPKEAEMLKELDDLIDFANDKDDTFIHPFIKAIILHFWIGYLHPFCDWNWRTARAIFYRYLNKKWYKDFTYIPISRAIKNSRKQYWDAYVYSSQEWYDLTFFLVYIAQKTQQAFKEYKEFILKQKEENGSLQVKISSLYGVLLNERQLSVITYFIENPMKYTNNSVYQNQYKVSQNTAKADLLWLKEIWLLQTKNEWNFINYYPTQALLDLWK